MEIQRFLLEVQLQTSEDINKIFNYALTQVFTPAYVKKINEVLQKEIQIKEVAKTENFNAYTQGKTIVINKPKFYSLNREQQVKTLLHEFIHILQTSKFLFFSRFKEISKLTKILNLIVKRNLTGSLSVFLTGEEKKMMSDDKEEILAYLIGDGLKWSELKPEGKKVFLRTLQESGVFNLGSSFWAKRL